MDARTLARLQAAGRLALGGGLVALPSLVAGGWVGNAAGSGAGRTLATGLGARDFAIALGTLSALAGGGRRGDPGSAPACWPTWRISWPRTRIVTLCPPLAVPAVAGLAGGSVLLGAYLQHALD